MSETVSRACPHCGNLQPEGAFCESCGGKMEPPAAASAPVPAPEAPAVASAPAPEPPAAQAPLEPVQNPTPTPPSAAAAFAPPPPAPAPTPAPAPAAAPTPAPTPAYQPPPQPPAQPPYAGGPGGPGGVGGAPSYGGPAAPRRSSGTGFISSLFDFSFTSFVTPKIIKFIFILTLAMIALGILVFVIAGFARSFGYGLVMLVVVAPIMAVVYLILARLWLEVVMVIFRIEEHLAELVKKD